VFAEMPFSAAHIPERFGLFTIIVFGESIVVTALGVAGGGFHTSAALAAAACFALACALWWLYFDRIEDNVLGGTIRPNLIFIYGHPPLFAALTAISVGAEFAIEHASGHALAVGERAILAGGVAATLAALSVVQAATLRPPPRPALARRGAATVAGLALIAAPVPALALCAALAALVAATAATETLS
jgi:low temperature requirement protein LtrA